MAQKIITYSFYILFFFTPLFWTPYNFELFEYNKMMLVYTLTTIIVAAWLWKMIQEKSLILKSTPLDIPLLLFLGANILSTIFSIDRHVSVWGYYSRSNGGLLSIFSYILLYFALVSNFSGKDVLNFLKSAIWGGVVVALYAIPEHFGISPSCVILTKQLNASCWVQDVQARVFATLGQPNWLAAYLTMLIFPAFYFLLNSTKKSFYILYFTFLIIFYMASTFTYSRGATLGLVGGLIVFLGLLVLHLKGAKLNLLNLNFKSLILNQTQWKLLAGILAVFILINLIFGSALSSFKLLSKFAPPPRPGLITKALPVSSTQLENGGTESGQIRLIVWQGAWEIFKHYPIFGSGVETFAYSYYEFRPASHNSVSEWDFLYNKAHNEFLNYLATTGLVGFLSYLVVISVFILWSIKYLVFSIKQKNLDTKYQILNTTLLASYISYHIQNFFGFSVVIVAVFFYLFPALAFMTTDALKPFKIPATLHSLSSSFQLIYRRPLYTQLTKTILIIVCGLVLFTLVRFYRADTYFATGSNASEAGNPGKAYNQLLKAISLNPGEPYYRSELAFSAASAAVALSEEDATTSARLVKEAESQTEQVIQESPKNVSFYRTKVRTYYLLSTLDKSFTAKTLTALDETIALAPTDAKLTYNKAVLLGQMGQNRAAIQAFEKTIGLKPNYRDVHYTLGLFFFDEKQKDQAIAQMKIVLELIPGDPEATEKLKEWGQ